MVRERKLFFVWNQDEEKKYLEEKAKQGLLLKKVGFGWYDFEEAEPSDVVYDFDFQIVSKKNEEDYLSFFGDWEFVVRFGGWYYFRKPKTDNNVLFSNNESKRKMYDRLLGFLLLTGFPLYYQVLIMFPTLRSRESISSFYKVFMPIAYILTGLHIFALIKIVYFRSKYSKSIVE